MKFIWTLILSFVFITDTQAKQDQWDMIKDKNGIKVYRTKVEGSGVLAFKGVAILPTSIEKILGILGSNERRKYWMPEIKSSKTLKEYTPYHRVEVNHLGAPWPLADRYFVTEGKLHQTPEGAVIVEMKSVHNEEFKQDPEGRILGEMHKSLYELIPVDENKTKFVVEFHTDPKGSLPKFLVNFFQQDFPYDLLSRLTEQAKDSTVVAIPKPPVMRTDERIAH